MDFADSMELYSKYLRIQAAELDIETVGEKAEEVCERLSRLRRYPDTTEKWCSAVERAVAETVEYINLCVYMSGEFGDGRSLIIPDAISVALELCELKHDVIRRDGGEDKIADLSELISSALEDIGTAVSVQEQKYWLGISRLFDIDEDGVISKKLEEDIRLIESGIKPNYEDAFDSDTEEEKNTTESIAMRVLKEALTLSDKCITISWIQRRFNFGYGKAAFIMDWLEEKGYVQTIEQMKREKLSGRRILVTEKIFKQ